MPQKFLTTKEHKGLTKAHKGSDLVIIYFACLCDVLGVLLRFIKRLLVQPQVFYDNGLPLHFNLGTADNFFHNTGIKQGRGITQAGSVTFSYLT